MAKKKSSKRSSKKLKPAWQSAPDDAIRLAALRWFALELERLGIQIYATDKGQFEAMERVFRRAIGGLIALHDQINAPLGDDGCPDGYMMCKDGLCAPTCDYIPVDA